MDNDFAIALQLQADLNESDEVEVSHKPDKKDDKPLSLVDHRWELMDPNPDARSLFLEFDKTFFWGRLVGVEVRWSPRMTSCAGVCCYEGRGGLCSIRLSKPLLTLRPRKDLIETLLHEMIHAYLFVTDNDKDHDGHGPEFHKHMNRINGKAGTNITVYHSFIDEVRHYQQHWWKCDGPCQHRPPYYGVTKRAMNRAPSKQDLWWDCHQRSCGGIFHKVKEPEGFGQKKTKQSERAKIPNGCRDIRKVFGSGGKQSNGKKQSDDDEFLYQSGDFSPPRLHQPLFPGAGQTLGQPKSKAISPHRIVRKLPGMGVVANEKPSDWPTADIYQQQQSDVSTNYDTDQDNWDDDVILYTPTKETLHRIESDRSSFGASPNLDRFTKRCGETSTTSEQDTSVSTNNASVSGNRKRLHTHVFDTDSDQEFEALLTNLSKKRKLSKKSTSLAKLKDLGKSSVGACRSIANFMSVSNPLSPEYFKQKYRNESRGRPGPSNHHTKGTKGTKGTKVRTVKDFAKDRNVRAIIGADWIVSNEEESGDESNAEEQDWIVSDTCESEPGESETESQDSYLIIDPPHKKSKPTATVSKAPSDIDDADVFDLTGFEDVWEDVGQAAAADHREPVAAVTQDTAAVSCPVCLVAVPASAINEHLDQCLG